MGSDRKARDGDFASAPTAVHAKKRAAAASQQQAVASAAAVEHEARPVAIVPARTPTPPASATLDEMVQLLRQGLTSDAPQALRTTDLVVRSGVRQSTTTMQTESAAEDDTPLDPPQPARNAYLPPGPDLRGTYARCAFSSEPPSVSTPNDIPRAPRIPVVHGVRLFAPTVSSIPPSGAHARWSLRALPRPLRVAGLLLIAAAAFTVAALLTRYW